MKPAGFGAKSQISLAKKPRNRALYTEFLVPVSMKKSASMAEWFLIEPGVDDATGPNTSHE